MALLLTPEKIPECCICLKDSVNRVIQTSGAAWRKQALGEKVEELCNKSVRENIEESNTGHGCASWPVSCSLVSSCGIPDTPAAGQRL